MNLKEKNYRLETVAEPAKGTSIWGCGVYSAVLPGVAVVVVGTPSTAESVIGDGSEAASTIGETSSLRIEGNLP